MIRRLLRGLSRRPRGGSLPPYRPGSDDRPVVLSPGRLITDPDEAEALGMTAAARRMRRDFAPPRPDYGRIDTLERELGLMPVEPERPIRRGPKVCLTKNCLGDTTDVHAWGGQLAVRIHTCEAP